MENDENVASSKKYSQLKTRRAKPNPKNVKNGQDQYLFVCKTAKK